MNSRAAALLAAASLTTTASGQFANFDAETEGFKGEVFSSGGVLFSNCNNVSGFFPDGQPFTPEEIGRQLIIEDSTVAALEFPGFISAPNTLTFGTAFIPGPNLSLGALAAVSITPPAAAAQAAFDIVYYENGPWGGILVTLDAVLAGQVVGTTSFTISDLNPGGRDNPTGRHMSIGGFQFDSLRLSARLHGEYTTMRALVDNVTFVPGPGAIALLALAALGAGRQRRRPEVRLTQRHGASTASTTR